MLKNNKKSSLAFCIKTDLKLLQSIAYLVRKIKAGANAFADKYMQTHLYTICYNYVSWKHVIQAPKSHYYPGTCHSHSCTLVSIFQGYEIQ